MHKFSLTLLSTAVALATGCATPPPAPPAEFKLYGATIVASDAGSALVLDGAPGKGQAAATGAVGGAGIALVFGGLACLATGPFIASCFSMLAPTVAVTAAGTAVVVAVMADTTEDVEAKRNLLRAAWSAPAAHRHLAEKLREKARAATGPGVTSESVGASPVRSDWTLRVTVTQFDTLGTGPDVAYALQASADLQVMRLGEEKPSFVKRYQAVSATKLTIAEWSSYDGEPVRTVLEGLLTTIAADMVAELTKNDLQRSSSHKVGNNALAFAHGQR